MYELEDSHWWFVGRRNLAMSLLDDWIALPPQARLLDVGCGTGGNLQALAGYGQGVGLDINPVAIELARRRSLPQLLQASGLTLPFASNTFDLVTIFDVLYHRWITDDHKALAEIYRVLRPGGWLLVTDSALPMLWSNHDETYYARQRYTLQNIREKLAEVGFEQRLCSYANMLLLPLFLLVRLTMAWLPLAENIDRQGTFPLWLNRLLTWVRGLEARWLRRGHTLPVGSSLVCLCQKPDAVELFLSHLAQGEPETQPALDSVAR
jgi:SAM-dependent methyltransferase